jgi:hypothetical protein
MNQRVQLRNTATEMKKYLYILHQQNYMNYHCCPTLTITISIGYGGCHFGFADQVAERLA